MDKIKIPIPIKKYNMNVILNKLDENIQKTPPKITQITNEKNIKIDIDKISHTEQITDTKKITHKLRILNFIIMMFVCKII